MILGMGLAPNAAWQIFLLSRPANSLCVSLTDPGAGLRFVLGVGFRLGLGAGFGLGLCGEAFFLLLPRVMEFITEEMELENLGGVED